MGNIILQFLPLAAAAVAPIMVVAVIILLSLDKGLLKGLAFIFGRILCYTTWTLLFIFVLGIIAEEASDPSKISLIFKTTLGSILIFLAIKNILKKKTADKKTPKWMVKLNKSKPLALLGIGFVLSIIQVRYVALLLAGLTIIAGVHLPTGQLIITIIILIFTIIWIQVLPIIIYLIMGKSAKKILENFKNWLTKHQNIINFIVLIIFGLILLEQGLSGLL